MDIPTICSLCFSKDRNLYLIANNEFDLFKDLSPQNHEFMQTLVTSSSLKVCFECRGRLKSVKNFIEMGLLSFKTLMKYSSSTEPVALICSSKLARSEIKIESLPANTEFEIEFSCHDVKAEVPEYRESDATRNGNSAVHMQLENTNNHEEDESEQYILGSTDNMQTEKFIHSRDRQREEPVDDEAMYFVDASEIKVEINSDGENIDLDSSRMGAEYVHSFEGESDSLRKNPDYSKHENGSENILLEVSKTTKKRAPKNKLWFLINIMWVSDEQAKRWYTSELEKDKKPGNKMRCDRCLKYFKGKEDLSFHILIDHDAMGATYECELCKYKFTKPIHLHRHIREHYLLYKCKLCDYESRYIQKMQIHSNEHENATIPRLKKMVRNTEGYPYWCRKCKHYFETKTQRQKHESQYGCYSTSQICNVCMKLFKNKDRYMHGCTQGITCSNCQETFKSLYFRKIHDCPFNAKPKPELLYCGKCDKYLKGKKSYHRHIRMSQKHAAPEEFQYPCPHCQRKFPVLPTLQRHINTIHLRPGAHKCTTCIKSFDSKMQLRRHNAKYHDESLAVVADKICNACGKAFEMQSHLDNHMRTHSGERPFKCNVCDRTFRQLSSLTSHHKKNHIKIEPRSKAKRKCKSRWQDTDESSDDSIPLRFASFVACDVISHDSHVLG